MSRHQKTSETPDQRRVGRADKDFYLLNVTKQNKQRIQMANDFSRPAENASDPADATGYSCDWLLAFSSTLPIEGV